MLRKRRKFETLPFLFGQLGKIWALSLLIVGVPVGVMWAAYPGSVIGFLDSFALFQVASISLIEVFCWLSGYRRYQARKRLIRKRRQAQGKRKLSLELGLAVMSQQKIVPIAPRSFRAALTGYLKTFSKPHKKEDESRTLKIWVAPGLMLNRILPRPATQLRYLLERIKELVHPTSTKPGTS